VSIAAIGASPFIAVLYGFSAPKPRLDRVVQTAVKLMMTLTTSRNLMNFAPALTAH
jgi:hypothetical protein